MRPLNDLTGMTFGYLTAIDLCGRKRRGATWRVRCICGEEKIIAAGELVRQRGISTRSCGCKERERKLIHGMKGHRAWRIFKGIKQRCNNPNNPGYRNYGGRGIRVEWKSFADFWRDMGPTYEPHLEIDRIDNNGPYSRDNCRWTTKQVNVMNRRNSILVNGESLTELANRMKVARSTVYSQYKRGAICSAEPRTCGG